MQGLFFTGTDTGVGKTVVTAGVAQLLRRQGRAGAVPRRTAARSMVSPDQASLPGFAIGLASCSQSSPAASRQDSPSGRVIRIVQVPVASEL